MATLHVIDGIPTLVKTDGTIMLLEFTEEVGPLCWGFFYFKSKENGLYGYMNELGEIVCEAKYKTAGNFDRTWHAAVESDTGFGFINHKGQENCKLIYDKVWYYNNRYAKVQKGEEILYIDLYGNEHSMPYVEGIWNSKSIN